ALEAPRSPAAAKVKVPGATPVAFETAAAFGPLNSPTADRSNSGARTRAKSKPNGVLRPRRARRDCLAKIFLTIIGDAFRSIGLVYPHRYQYADNSFA